VFSYLRTLTTWHCPQPLAARRCCSNRSVSFASRAHSSKSVAPGLLLWADAGSDSDGRKDRWTDGPADRRSRTVPFHRPCSVHYAGNANKAIVYCRLRPRHPWYEWSCLVLAPVRPPSSRTERTQWAYHAGHYGVAEALATCRQPIGHSPVWARGRCRISPPRFLAECCKRQLNQVSLVQLYFRLSAFSDLY